MQRKIHIDVTGNRAAVSSRELGTQGEVAAVTLLLTFDGGWDGLAKRLLWRAADGSASAYTLLTGPDSGGVYSAAVPALPLSAAGRAELTVEGVETDGGEVERRARSVLISFAVEPNDLDADSEAGAVDATVAEQLASALEGKAALSHTHTRSQISDFSHTHPKSQITGFAHTHTKSDVTDFAHGHTRSDISNFSHTHTRSDVSDFAHTHKKADVTDFAHTHAKADVTDFAHTHTKDDVTDFAHTHAKADVTDFSHTHTKAEITDFAHTHSVAASDVSYNDGGVQTNLQTKIAALAAGMSESSVTLAANAWTGSEAPYTQSASVAGLTSASHVLVAVGSGATDAQFEAACGARLRFSAGSGSLAVKAYGEKPTVAIPLAVGVIA